MSASPAIQPAAPLALAPLRPAGLVRRLFRDKPMGAVAGVVFLLFLFCGVFADFIGTMGSSDSSRACDRGSWVLPSRGCLLPAMVGNEALSRSPGSRAERFHACAGSQTPRRS